MPISWAALFRVVVLLLMAAHVFYLYTFARTYQEMVGPDFATVFASSSFALAMLIPLAWAVALPDLPEIIRSHLSRRRWSQGRCPECGYPVIYAEGGTCPECGADRGEPRPFWIGWPTARRFAMLAAGAWLLGCVAAESWTSADEAAFRNEGLAHLEASDVSQYSRPRRWPMGNERLYYTHSEGATAFPPGVHLPGGSIESPR